MRFKSKNILLINILIHYCLHTCNTSQLLCFKTSFTCTARTCGTKAGWMSSFNVTLLFTLLYLGPPVVEIVPPALSTLKGVTAKFTCHAEGFPLPNITWMRQTGLGESEISSSRVNVQINSHDGSSQLIVQNTSLVDSGYYICIASNYVSDTAGAFLGVVCKLHLNM